MSQKFHINSKGVASPCRAKNGNCPYGGSSGSENHFDSYEEAQEKADELMEAEYGLLYKEEKDFSEGSQWSNETLKEGTLKAAAQIRLELEEEDYDSDSKYEVSEVVSDYSKYLDSNKDENPKSLHEFYQSGGARSNAPEKEDYNEVKYDYYAGPTSEKFTESSHESYNADMNKYEEKNEEVSTMIENLEVTASKMEKTNWKEKGMTKNEAMSEFYYYVSDVYSNN